MRSLLVAIIVLCSLGASNAQAYYIIGNSLYDICSDGHQAADNVCRFHIAGVVDSAEMGLAPFQSCIPAAVSVAQLQDVVTAYYAERPQIRHEAAAPHVINAISAAFNC